RVEHGAQAQRAVVADAPERRLQSYRTAEARWNAHRAAGIAADRRGRKPASHGDAGSAAGTPRHPVSAQIPGIARRAHGGIRSPAPEGEFNHVRLAENDGARRLQASHDRRGDRRNTIAPVERTARRRAPLDFHEILDGDRYAVQRAETAPGRA